jgi:hypothetical protein
MSLLSACTNPSGTWSRNGSNGSIQPGAMGT